MKALRNVVRFCVMGLSVSAFAAGCSDDPVTPPIGGTPTTAGTGNNTGGMPPAGTAGTAGSAATTAGTGGTGQTTGGTGTGGTGTGGTGTGGTTGGTGLTTAGTGGTGTGGTTGGTGTGGTTGGTGGTGTGGTTAGTGGTGTGGTTGGTGGGTGVDFPPGCNAPTGTHSATALTRTCWSTMASDCTLSAQNMNPPKQAIDADTSTRFSTGKKMLTGTAFTFEVVLGTDPVMIDGISALSNATDYAPSLMVSVSTDGTNFTNVACGTGAMTTDFSFPAVSAKVVRLTQYGVIDKWWSIMDFNVYGTGTTCGGGAGTPTDMCTTQHNTGAE